MKDIQHKYVCEVPTLLHWQCIFVQCGVHTTVLSILETTLPPPEKPNINQTFVSHKIWQTRFHQLLLCKWDSAFAEDHLYHKVNPRTGF